jgi:hypothetical protein
LNFDDVFQKRKYQTQNSKSIQSPSLPRTREREERERERERERVEKRDHSVFSFDNLKEVLFNEKFILLNEF